LVRKSGKSAQRVGFIEHRRFINQISQRLQAGFARTLNE
jgi:hypothetical protein